MRKRVNKLPSVRDILLIKKRAMDSVPDYGELGEVLGGVLRDMGADDIEGFLKAVRKETSLWVKMSAENRALINSYEDSRKQFSSEVVDEESRLAGMTTKELEEEVKATVIALRNMEFGWSWIK